MTRNICFVFLLQVLSSQLLSAQNVLSNYLEKFNTYAASHLTEKLFVHLDRSFYVAGETMWMKIYLVDGYMHQPLTSSKVAYIEILDNENKAIIQTKIELDKGKGNGSIQLPAPLSSGNYQVRAYTSWMKNFSPELYFHQHLTIVNVFRTLEEGRSLRKPDLDVQLFPEGGYLVDGIRSRIGFRVVDEKGAGISFRGFVTNSKGDTVAQFEPLKFGIGSFQFTPDKSERYTVAILEENGKITNGKFPEIQSEGYTLQITDTTENRLHIKVGAKGNLSSTVYFIGHTRQVVKIASAHRLNNGQLNFMISKNELGKGISHLTLFDSSFKPLNERLVAILPANDAGIHASVDQSVYSTRSKIELMIRSTAALKNVNLSVAVFKDDSLQQFKAADIRSYLYLASDLGGHIESSDYYFTGDPIARKALDNLMITQGWTRFTWKDVEQDKKDFIKFLPEYRGHLITALINDKATVNPLPGIKSYLATPGKQTQLYSTLSNREGIVQFEMKSFYGIKKIFIQTSLPDSLVSINLITPFSDQASSFSIPPLSINEKLEKNLTARSVSMQVNDVFRYPEVKPVVVALDTSAFYGQPAEQYYLDDYIRFPIMEEVLREYVKAVRVRKKDNHFYFKVVNMLDNTILPNEPLAIIDGIPVFNTDQIMELDPLRVKRLDVITRTYFHGPLAYDGIVSFRTYHGDMGGIKLDKNNFVLDYQALQANKEFFSPRYETIQERNNRLPDARHLLYWNPDVEVSEPQTLDFYSSDQPGRYKIIIQGVSSGGHPVYQTHSFQVNKSR